MQAVLGRSGTVVMALAILVSTFGCVNGLCLAGARVYYAMARDGLFFSRAATTNRHHVPAVALVAQGSGPSLLVLPVTVGTDRDRRSRSTGTCTANCWNTSSRWTWRSTP